MEDFKWFEYFANSALRLATIIKGSSSTLYGGGAIAGLVNMVSKHPGDRSRFRYYALKHRH
jgi:outer membrane receptor protein involved in Fe transport